MIKFLLESVPTPNMTLKKATQQILVPVVVAVIIGMGSAYLTATVKFANIEVRLSKAENNIQTLQESVTETQETLRQSRERVIRIETKVDLLLRAQGVDPLQRPKSAPDQ